MKTKVLLIILIIPILSYSQNDFFVVKGNVLNSENSYPIKKATISIKELKIQTETGKDGHFGLALPYGNYTFIIEHSNYKTTVFSVKVTKDTIINISVEPLYKNIQLKEIIVNASTSKIESPQTSIEYQKSIEAQKIPSIGGEKDILKAFTLKPGVVQSNDGYAGLNVRGGTNTENITLLDNAIIYQPAQLFGLISTFSTDIVKSATLYKGSFPAKFGGATSAIFDAQSQSAIPFQTTGKLNISPVLSTASIKIPLIKNKAGVFINFRRTFFDQAQQLAFKYHYIDEIKSFNFYDLFFKTTYFISNKTKIDILFYNDRNNTFAFSSSESDQIITKNLFENSNNIFALNLKTNFSNNISYNSAISFSQHNAGSQNLYKLKDTIIGFKKYNNFIKDLKFDNILDWKITDKKHINLGYSFIHYTVCPAENLQVTYNDTLLNNSYIKNKAYENIFFVDYQWEITKRLKSITGIRMSNYYQDKNLLSIEPRISLNYKLSEKQSLKFAYAKLSQNVHQLSTPIVGLQSNIWLLTNSKIKTEKSDIFTLSFSKKTDIKNNNIFSSIDLYYKNTQNVIQYLDGYSNNFFMQSNQIDITELTTQGTAKAYGIEVYLSKTNKKLSTSIAYTLSWTKLYFKNLNNSIPFYANNDRRHSLSFFCSYSFSPALELSSSFTFMTGSPISLPNSIFVRPSSISTSPDTYYTVFYSYGDRNSFRMKPYHRLDLSVIWHIPSKKIKQTLSLDIFNVYNRKNPSFYYIDKEYNIDPKTLNTISEHYVLKSVSILPVIPSLTYSIKF